MHGLGDGAEVLVLALLAGLVVVGIRRKDSGEALNAAELLGTVDRLARGVVGGSGEDRNAAVRGLNGDFDDAQPFGLRKSGGFAGCATGDQQRDTASDLPVNVGTEGGLIE